MTISVKHSFQSAKGDGTDATLVQPSKWNAEHTFTCATDKLIGRATAGTGAIEEIAATAFGRSLLACADLPALLSTLGVGMFTTGDAKFTFKTTADSGWLMVNDGTIGDASSSATTRASADCLALYSLIWANVSDTWAPVTGGRGASAAADFAAHKPMAISKLMGRALAVAGIAGAGLTGRALGQFLGEEAHQLTVAELAGHTHANSLNDPGHTHQYFTAANKTANAAAGTGNTWSSGDTIINTGSAGTGVTISNAGAGSDAAHNNMQPSTFLNLMIKL